MKTGILITARLGSTRLKKKHLLKINEQPIILYLIKRIQKEFDIEISKGEIKLIIATSDELENREFELLSDNGISIFYGSIANIPLRHLQCAGFYKFENIISIDGDDILCSIYGMRQIFNALKKGNKYIKTFNLPFGMNSTGYSTDFLELSLVNHQKDILETGWGRIFDEDQLIKLNMPILSDNNLLRFTLDYWEDFIFFRTIINTFGDKIYTVSDEEIINFVISQKIYLLNEVIAKTYWENFNENIRKEAQLNESGTE